MYELVRAGERSYYIESPAKVGLIRLEGSEVCLIDSGSDRDAGRRILKIIDAQGWKLRAIYNTHSNADHIGGNRFLQERTGCAIYAPGIERDFTCHTLLEPAFLYGGYPPKELRHKFLLAPESRAEALTPEVLPEGVEMIPLPGHFFDMTGFRAPDGVVFLADCLSSAETLEKYQIGFVYDVAAYLDTLERVQQMRAPLFIPAHAAPAEDVSPLAKLNVEKVREIAARIEDNCREGLCFEELLKRLFDDYGLTLNFQQYALVGSTLRSYLSYLKEAGRLEAAFVENRLLWRAPN